MAPLVYNPPPGSPVILHEDPAFLIVEKPAGLLTVPGKSAEHADCLQSRLVAIRPEALLVHRLDMDTSGLIVFARNRSAQRNLGLQFERRKVAKTYEALVLGQVAGDEGEIDLPLAADWPRRPLQKVCHETGRRALTNWRLAERTDDRSRLHLHPLTGRSHQLRVHTHALGHPILGDPLYGDGTDAPRMMLHATRIEFHHPIGGVRVAFTSACPF